MHVVLTLYLFSTLLALSFADHQPQHPFVRAHFTCCHLLPPTFSLHYLAYLRHPAKRTCSARMPFITQDRFSDCLVLNYKLPFESTFSFFGPSSTVKAKSTVKYSFTFNTIFTLAAKHNFLKIILTNLFMSSYLSQQI